MAKKIEGRPPARRLRVKPAPVRPRGSARPTVTKCVTLYMSDEEVLVLDTAATELTQRTGLRASRTDGFRAILRELAQWRKAAGERTDASGEVVS